MTEECKIYVKTATQRMRPYIPGEDLTDISVSVEDTPELGGMIAIGSDNDARWYVSKDFFNSNYEEVTEDKGMKEKTLHNSDVSGAKINVSDLAIVGNGDMFQLLCKASSQEEGWMKSTKGMQTETGVVIQVTTQQRNEDGTYAVAEALTFVPGARIVKDANSGKRLA